MSKERWQKVKLVLDEALNRSPQTRGDFVAAACGGDAELRAEVESYLKYELIDDDVLEEDIFCGGGALFRDRSDLIGMQFGKYRILKELGAGGMGVVFLAERCDGEFEQKVAVKFLGQGLFSKAARRRFLQERQILAHLRHENIAALIDGGTTDEGIPFLVMEYVEGRRLTDYADELDLTIAERLEIFRKICAAVSFAHRNLIVHRDLKPANILITDAGEPKLLDFGIAKLVSADGAEHTQTQNRALTPEYASPEQLRGEIVTTSSDIYVLGIILYELLTGSRPFGGRSEAEKAKAFNAASREKPPRPSSVNRLTGSGEKNQSGEAKQRAEKAGILRGDLDNIVLKALNYDPEKRYASVEQLVEDLERFESGLPVSARPSTFAYRADKFIRRNRLSVAAAALLLTSIIGGGFIAAQQAYLARKAEARAEQRLRDLRGLTSSLMLELNDEISQSPTRARLELARKSSEYLNNLLAEAQTDPTVKHDLAAAYLKLGDLQGRPYYPNIGQTEAARETYRGALELLTELARENAANNQIKADLARAHERLGYLLGIRFSDRDAATRHLLTSLKLREELSDAEPENAAYRAALADSCLYLADMLHGFEKMTIGSKNDLTKYDLAKRALEIRQKLLSENPADASRKRDVALAFQRAANSVFYFQDDTEAESRKKTDERLFYHESALRLREQLANNPASIMRDQRNLADQLMMMSDLLSGLERFEDAEKNLKRSKEIFHSLTLVDPFDSESLYDYGNALWRLGKVLKLQNRKAAARAELAAAKNTAETIVAQNPSSTEYRSLLNFVIDDLNSL